MIKEYKYYRDKRSPLPKNIQISLVMSGNKAKDTKPELLLRKALWKEGIRGYKLHLKSLPGKPDITFMKKKIVIFINGCYWHRCPKCNLPIPKYNSDFWKTKFIKNKNRDKQKEQTLSALGWKVITIWECELKKELNSSLNKIKKALKIF